MNYAVEDINTCKKKLDFHFCREDIEAFGFDSKIINGLREKQKNVSLRGFRKGKAPINMIKNIYGPELKRSILEEFIFQEIGKAVDKEFFQVVNMLPVQNLEYKEGGDLSFKVLLEVTPTIEFKDISGYVFTRGDCPEVSEKEIDEVIKNVWLLPKSEMQEVADEGLALGQENVGIVNLKGIREDGSVAMEEKEYWIDGHRNDILPIFWENVLGMKKGERKAFEWVVPEDHSDEDWQGKKLSFDMELLEIKEYHLPEINDGFAVECGFKSVDMMHSGVGELLEKKRREDVEKSLRHDIEEKLLEDNPFEVPEVMVERRKKSAVESITKKMEEAGHSSKDIGAYMERYGSEIHESALRVTKLSVIFHTFAKKYNVKISEKDSDGSFENKIFKTILENVTIQQMESSPA